MNTADKETVGRYEHAVPAQLPPALVPQLKPYVSASDVSLLSQSLSILTLLLESSPSYTFPEVERLVLQDVYSIASSPQITGASLDAVLAFFAALVEADTQIAAHVVPSLVKSVVSASKGDASPANAAKCVAQVVRSYPAVAAGVIAEYSKHVKVRLNLVFLIIMHLCTSLQKSSKATISMAVLSLLILGEIGRFVYV